MKQLLVFILSLLLLVSLAVEASRFLVVDSPQHSDVILVLAGETNRRPQRALQLLAGGYGGRIILDVPARTTIYEFTQIQLAQKYIQDLPQGSSISICSIEGLSTEAEAKDTAACLARTGARSVLIVTSDFHTRRALSIFRRKLPAYTYSTAAAHDDEQFGVGWWKHRQWAKTLVDEWLRLLWWKCVDQWR
jgi:hypothetical protein